MEYHLGFSGTRLGMTSEQRHGVRTEMALFRENFGYSTYWFHHGDCIGSDAEAHEIAKALGYKIHVHPPIQDKFRAWCADYDKISEPKTYRQRNTDIVRESLYLVAAVNPNSSRGGTWMTVGIARNLDVVPILVFPSGLVEK